MTADIIVAVLALVGTLVGSIAGILTANKLSTYRIGELEKKVDEYRSIGVRVSIIEQENKQQWDKINEMRDDIKAIRKEVTKESK